MNSIAYFDNSATTFPKPEEVYAFTDKFSREGAVNVGRGQYSLSSRATAIVSETRELLLALNHCLNKRVVFTPTATEALNVILRGIELCDGSNVYVSPFEHNAVMRVLHYISESKRLNIITLAFDKERFGYDLEKIRYQFASENPNLVVVSHASNVCGIIAPITEIAAAAKIYGAVNVVDMCQTMGLIDTDLSPAAVDYAVFAGHKTLYAPFGVSGFICNADSDLKPIIYGGTGIDSASRTLPPTVPERFETGSQNVVAIAGLNAALKWASGIGIENIFQAEQRSRTLLIDVLRAFDNTRIVSPISGENAVGVVSCVFDGFSSDSIGQILSTRGIAVRTGLHCAPDAHRFLGTFPSGTVRFSVSYFNNDDDFALLGDALSYIHENS
jgi:cysteine desulfurase family protein